MIPLIVDFETYYDADFSLKKLPTLYYIRSPKFKVHGASIKHADQPAQWISGSDLPHFFADIPWSETQLISHNALFDVTIAYEHYGVEAGSYVDTLGLCRALLPRDLKFDLNSIGQTLGLGSKVKDGFGLYSTKGLYDLSPEVEAGLAEYAIGDAELEYQLYRQLYRLLPEQEREVMDIFIRMSCIGVLHFDTSMAAEGYQDIIQNRNRKLRKIGLEPDENGKCPVLTGRDSFAELLRARGVEPPLKTSPKNPDKITYAFSKQDPAFIALKNIPEVADLMEARLVWASNSEITRLNNLIKIAELPPHTLPVQVHYNGTHTGRGAGGGKINMQNPQRGSKLRLSITAPPEHVIVVADSAQIELRLNMGFSGQHDVLARLGTGEYVQTDDEIKFKGDDIYRSQAAEQFQITSEQVNKDQRQFGKVCELGLGYQMGAKKFRVVCATGPQGLDPILLTHDQAQTSVDIYREARPHVVNSWYFLHNHVLPYMMNKDAPPWDYGPVTFEYEAVRLPNGLYLTYPNLRYDEEGDILWGLGDRKHKIYGAKLQENIIQTLAGIVIKGCMVQIRNELQGISKIVHQVHDEILVVTPKVHAKDVLRLVVLNIMSKSPDWAPHIPLRAEGKYDFRYSK